MNKETRRVLSLAALIVATGVATVELTRSEAQADPALVTGGAAGYAGDRIDTAFQVAAEVSAMEQFEIALGDKGDLFPIGCAGPFRADVAAECVDTAYEVPSPEFTVVQTRVGESTSVLTRMMKYTVAGF